MKKNSMDECPLCAVSSGIYPYDTGQGIYYCSACDHAYTVQTDEQREAYNEDYFIDAHKNWFKHPNFRLFKYILSKTGDRIGLNILDVGCGKGDFLIFAAQHDVTARLTGSDLTEIDAPAFNYIRGDFLTVPFSGTFDVIVSLAVIEHLEDPGAFMGRIGELLAPDGQVFIMTNNTGSVIYRCARLLKRFGFSAAFDRLYSAHHVNHFSNRSLTIALEKTGFSVESIHNHNYPFKAVDVPPAHPVIQFCYKVAVLAMFVIGFPINAGFLQTVQCRRKT